MSQAELFQSTLQEKKMIVISRRPEELHLLRAHPSIVNQRDLVKYLCIRITGIILHPHKRKWCPKLEHNLTFRSK